MGSEMCIRDSVPPRAGRCVFFTAASRRDHGLSLLGRSSGDFGVARPIELRSFVGRRWWLARRCCVLGGATRDEVEDRDKADRGAIEGNEPDGEGLRDVQIELLAVRIIDYRYRVCWLGCSGISVFSGRREKREGGEASLTLCLFFS